MWKIIKKLDKLHLFLGLILVAFVTMGASIPSHISRLDSLVVALDPTTTTSVTVGDNDAYFHGTVEFNDDVRFDSTTTLGSGSVAYTWPTADGSGVLTSNGSGTLTWGTGAATAYDDITKPDADSTIVFDNDRVNLWTFADINEDMFRIQGIGAFGNFSVVRIEQVTGAATDGTVLEVVAEDADVDPLVVSASGKANALVVGQNTGVVTIAGVLEGTSAVVVTAGDIKITAGDLHVDAGDCLFDEDVTVGGWINLTGDLVGGTGLINYTHFDVDATGAMTNVGAITSDADITTTANLIAVDGTFSGDVSVTGTFQQDAISAATAATTLTLDGTGAGGVGIGTVAGTGTITLGGSATLVDLPSTVDLTLSGGDLAVTDTANADMVTFTNNTMTTADLLTLACSGTRTSNNMIAISDASTTANTIGITANTQTSGHGIAYGNTGQALTGAALYLAVTDGVGFTGYYLHAYDGSATDFSIRRYGATVIGGLANTDMFTITTGKAVISDGLLDVDTNEDHSSSFTRDYAAGGTAAVLVVDDTNVASTKPALEINQDGTGASEGIKIVHDGDGAAIDISCGVARTVASLIDITTTNSLATNALFIDGAWTGASTVGAIEINTTGNIASGASMIRLDYDTGTPAGTGFAIEIDDDSGDGAGVGYAVLINSANNEGLHVQTGLSAFVEAVTFTAQSVHSAGIDADGDVDIDLSANSKEVTIETTAQDFAAGSGLLQIHGDHAGNTTGDMSLIRLVYQGNGIANDSFIECVDASTGAASNGDTQFKVDSGGDITTAGTLTVNGATVVGDGATQMYGFVGLPVDMGASPVDIEIADSGKIYYNGTEAQIGNLPACAAGLRYTFVVVHGSLLTIHPDGTDRILILTDTNGDKITSSTPGDTITLISIGSIWYTESIFPTNTDWADAGA
ncbi:MAG: hypothetical protein KAX30_04270 [Candidatus Atribacteria bacterium]|nr:hypothetical protein [Candidatus Atribacteria bacterium]